MPSQYKKVVIPFSLKTIILLNCASIGVIALMSGILFYSQHSYDNKLSAKQDAFALKVQAINDFSANNMKPSLDKTLALRVSRYETVLHNRQKFFDKMNSESFGFTTGFSEYLQAFSRQNFPQIWLDSVSIKGGSEAMTITGLAVNSYDIPAYLEKLQAEPIFNGILFDNLTLDRQKLDKGDFIKFRLNYGDIQGGATASRRNNSNRPLASSPVFAPAGLYKNRANDDLANNFLATNDLAKNIISQRGNEL